MFEGKGKIKDISRTLGGEFILSLTVPASITRFYDDLTGKDLRIELKEWKERRSLDANAYFHVLVSKIAEKMNISAEQVKKNMVLDYGSIMRDENGDKVGFKLPASVDVNSIYKYAKQFDTRTENGKEFNCFIVYKETHTLDSTEMQRLISGVCQECDDLGIDHITPAEREKMMVLWGEK